MRGLAVALVSLALSVPGAAAEMGVTGRVAFIHDGRVILVDLATGKRTVALTQAPAGPIRWSGDAKLLSDAGRIAGGPKLHTSQVVWAPSGETAAYATKSGEVALWTPTGSQAVVPATWGATSIAWGPNGTLALGRTICHVPCGMPRHQEVWTWRAGSLRRVVGPLPGVVRPIVTGFSADGRVLWWPDEQGSASLAADGLLLHANNSRIATTLAFPDYVVRCGRHLAVAAGSDRFTTHGKRILFDGRDVSRDRTRSWVSPSCDPEGIVIAAAGRNWQEAGFGHEHRAIWQLLPARKRLTQPPPGWTDENPHLLADGSTLFVRTRQTAHKVNGEWFTTSRGLIELLTRGKLVHVANVGFTSSEVKGPWLNYYGHYNWPWWIAVAP